MSVTREAEVDFLRLLQATKVLSEETDASSKECDVQCLAMYLRKLQEQLKKLKNLSQHHTLECLSAEGFSIHGATILHMSNNMREYDNVQKSAASDAKEGDNRKVSGSSDLVQMNAHTVVTDPSAAVFPPDDPHIPMEGSGSTAAAKTQDISSSAVKGLSSGAAQRLRRRHVATKAASHRDQLGGDDDDDDDGTVSAEITAGLVTSTKRLKEALLGTQDKLRHSNKVLEKHAELLDGNIAEVTKEQRRLEERNSVTCASLGFSLCLMVLCVVIFCGMFLFMRIIPKPKTL